MLTALQVGWSVQCGGVGKAGLSGQYSVVVWVAETSGWLIQFDCVEYQYSVAGQ